jgi:uncharacterized protein (DUF885 family)
MNPTRAARFVRLALPFVAALAAACSETPSRPAATAARNARFAQLAHEMIETTCRCQPTQATFLGIHTFDDQLEDWSRDGVAAEIAALQRLRDALAALDEAPLSAEERLDREQLVHAAESRILTLGVIRPWANNPDLYSSGVTNAAYIMVKRAFAPPATRLRLLIARERAMPAAFAAARANLSHPPRILTEIALEQLDGNRAFFATAVPEAFQGVDDAALLAEFRQANDEVVAAFDAYAVWLRDDLLPRSDGDFAIGADTYRKKLWHDEMVDLPLAELLKIAEEDLARNQAAFDEAARRIDPKRSATEVLATLQLDHPPAAALFKTTQDELDSLASFLTDHRIVTIPAAAAARVQETPPFMRAMTSASMDTPGPFERVATEAYYSMTLPDPAGTAEATEEFMKQWYYASITNVSVHEVWPGHYLQFLYAKEFPSDVRRVYGANTNVEGWAHYCEEMVIDEGLHAGDPKYRLAQLQDALLRDVRCIVGIRLHTQGMTVEQAEQLFVDRAFQPRPVARSEAKRGTSDPTYGYYTLGKLMILKLRKEWQAKAGSGATLQEFHDTFIRLGPLPLPLIRRAMLGESGRAL